MAASPHRVTHSLGPSGVESYWSPPAGQEGDAHSCGMMTGSRKEGEEISPHGGDRVRAFHDALSVQAGRESLGREPKRRDRGECW